MLKQCAAEVELHSQMSDKPRLRAPCLVEAEAIQGDVDLRAWVRSTRVRSEIDELSVSLPVGDTVDERIGLDCASSVRYFPYRLLATTLQTALTSTRIRFSAM